MLKVLLILWAVIGVVVFVWIMTDEQEGPVTDEGNNFLLFGLLCGPLLWLSIVTIYLAMFLVGEDELDKIEDRIRAWVRGDSK